MDWPVLDYLFNLIFLSGIVAILIILTIIWGLIINMIGMCFKNRRQKND